MNKILISDAVSKQGFQDLASIENFEVVDGSSWSRQELLDQIKNFHALVIRSSTTADAQLLEQAKDLKVLVRAGTGIDNIDVACAAQNGITVMNTPGTNAQAAAELTIGLMLSQVRHIPQATKSVLEGQWERKKYVGLELYEKTLGLIGLGNIGQRVAKIARAFSMRVVGFDPKLDEDQAQAYGVELLPMDEVLAVSDFLSLHAALNDKTRHMVDSAMIAKMKAGVCLINCARAELIHQEDLLNALKSGHIASAALDVLDQEPPSTDHPLVSHPQVIVTPHLGASTKEAQDNVMKQVTKQLKSYFEDGQATNVVRP